MASQDRIEILYYTDILCFWAYAAQIRIDELKRHFGDRIRIANHFISVFGSTQDRIGRGWKDRGGYAGFAANLLELAEAFPHVEVNPEAWHGCRPKTSATGHLFVKAAQLLHAEGTLQPGTSAESDPDLVDELEWRIRCAFFVDARDISDTGVLMDLAADMGLAGAEIQKGMLDGTALAALSADLEHKSAYQLQGSPTLLMNNGRQKLYGNVGYKVMEANVTELLENPHDRASWC